MPIILALGVRGLVSSHILVEHHAHLTSETTAVGGISNWCAVYR
jgi:hypothetical protein